MERSRHLFSETATWKTKSEFMDAQGKASKAFGESKITVFKKSVKNDSWTLMGGNMVENHYDITPVSESCFGSRSENTALGVQRGRFDIHGNTLFSKFFIEETELRGYEVISREGDVCHASGALYNGDDLINTWKAKMTKQ